ncbi:CubicO group peptidase (beta-lactamase class C family) [Friedmanniella endophytica]|uniref:CubicO group peptidase (Beta-lactamase class C family) n=1 Tax=Microlunatus kandeliicorticis TaxID=1759536 RepID=A0A7W3P6W6_9ACTN|nr:serine hydrolase [Microlunatus kandeliicorticis]MBA8795345.1 CubicO group peptidase (beta-lactamase class C family) [Microlunatus kandeliicorticis]
MPTTSGPDFSSSLQAFLDGVAADDALELHSLIVRQHGRELARGWWEPYRRDDVHLLYSLSKSFTSTAAGFAVAEGLLDLDRPAHSYIPGAAEVITDDRSARITVRDALRMATGHTVDTLDRLRVEAQRHDPPLDLPVAFFALPPEQEPGSVFCYNNGATYLVAVIVQSLVGEPLSRYLTPRLFEPLGIATPYWQTDAAGREIGFSGLHLPTEAVAAFGQLYLDGGRLGDRQVLPEGWAAEASTAHTPNPGEPTTDWQQGYGYQFWRSQHGFRGDGAYGQFCLVLPEQDAVVAMTSDTDQMQALLDLVWAHLLPALDATADPAAPGTGAPDPIVLDALALPVIGGHPAPVPAPVWTPTPPSPEQPAPISVLEVSEDRLVLGHPDGDGERRYELGLTPGGWCRTELDLPEGRLLVGTSAGWTGPDTFEAALAMINTPHRLEVRGQVSAGDDGTPTATSTVGWRLPPLGPTHPWMLTIPRASVRP